MDASYENNTELVYSRVYLGAIYDISISSRKRLSCTCKCSNCRLGLCDYTYVPLFSLEAQRSDNRLASSSSFTRF